MSQDVEPKFELEIYRQFIRDASSYIAIVIGRKITAKQADSMSDEELRRIAILIDSRVSDLKPSARGKPAAE